MFFNSEFTNESLIFNASFKTKKKKPTNHQAAFRFLVYSTSSGAARFTSARTPNRK